MGYKEHVFGVLTGQNELIGQAFQLRTPEGSKILTAEHVARVNERTPVELRPLRGESIVLGRRSFRPWKHPHIETDIAEFVIPNLHGGLTLARMIHPKQRFYLPTSEYKRIPDKKMKEFCLGRINDNSYYQIKSWTPITSETATFWGVTNDDVPMPGDSGGPMLTSLHRVVGLISHQLSGVPRNGDGLIQLLSWNWHRPGSQKDEVFR